MPAPCNEWVVHDLTTALANHTLWGGSSTVHVVGGVLSAATTGGGGSWEFAIPDIALDPTKRVIVEVTYATDGADDGTGRNEPVFKSLASVDPAVETDVSDDYHDIGGGENTSDEGEGWHQTGTATFEYYFGPDTYSPDAPWVFMQNNFDTDVVGKGYVGLLFRYVGAPDATTQITQIRTFLVCPDDEPIPTYPCNTKVTLDLSTAVFVDDPTPGAAGHLTKIGTTFTQNLSSIALPTGTLPGDLITIGLASRGGTHTVTDHRITVGYESATGYIGYGFADASSAPITYNLALGPTTSQIASIAVYRFTGLVDHVITPYAPSRGTPLVNPPLVGAAAAVIVCISENNVVADYIRSDTTGQYVSAFSSGSVTTPIWSGNYHAYRVTGGAPSGSFPSPVNWGAMTIGIFDDPGPGPRGQYGDGVIYGTAI